MSNFKTLLKGSFLTQHINRPINRFGYCKFAPEETLLGFGLMLLYVGELDSLKGVGAWLQGDQLNAFENYSDRFGLPYSEDGEELTIR